MAILSLRFTDEEYNSLKTFAAVNGVSLNKAVKDAFFEKLEESYDLASFDKAYAEYLKDKHTYTREEVEKEFGLDR